MAESSQAGRGRGPGRRFPPGHSGNPGGLPPWVAHIRRLAGRVYGRKALRTLGAALDDPDPRVRVAAAFGILDRAGVKPIAADQEVPGATPGQVIVVLAMPERETRPSFLVGQEGVQGLPAKALDVELAQGHPDCPSGGQACESGHLDPDAPILRPPVPKGSEAPHPAGSPQEGQP